MEEALENKGTDYFCFRKTGRIFSPLDEICETCGHTARVKNCDVGLTVVQKIHNQLKCHHCGYSSSDIRKVFVPALLAILP